jgi:hypothetical protein
MKPTCILFSVAALAACSSSRTKSMVPANLSPEHVAWISETAPHAGRWMSAVEGEGAWVDAFQDEHGDIVLLARGRDPSKKVSVALFDAAGKHPAIKPQPVRSTIPPSGVLDVAVYFEETLLNSYPYPPDLRGQLQFKKPK